MAKTVFYLFGTFPETPLVALTCLLGTEIHHQVLVGEGIAFEAGGKQDVLVVHRHQTEAPWGSHVELLEGLKALSEVIPQVYPGEGEVAAKNEVLAKSHNEGIHCHRAPRGQSLDFHKTLPFPAEDLGVTYEAREAKVENFPHPEVLYHLHVG